MDSTSDAIKALALEGSFGAISEKYGAKKCSKAENYVKVKLDALADKVEKGVSLDGVPYATPFMMFAVAHKDEELGAVAKLFLAPAQVEELENSQLSASITPSSQSKNTPSQSSSAENNLETQLNPIATVIVTPMRAPSVVKAKGFQPPSAQKDTVAEVKIVKPSSSSDKKGKKVKSDGKKVVAVKSAKPQKVPKDPNAPKGAKGSYMFFSAEMRAGS